MKEADRTCRVGFSGTRLRLYEKVDLKDRRLYDTFFYLPYLSFIVLSFDDLRRSLRYAVVNLIATTVIEI